VSREAYARRREKRGAVSVEKRTREPIGVIQNTEARHRV
jgi:hypothetical protein